MAGAAPLLPHPAVVENQAEARLAETQLAGNFSRFDQQMPST